MQIKTTPKNFFIHQTAKGKVACFGRKPLARTARTGFVRTATIKKPAINFGEKLRTNFTTEEKLVAGKIMELLQKNNKTSYDELYSRVSSWFSKIGLRLGTQIINNNSVAQLCKKLIKVGAITEEKQNKKAAKKN
jgi:hypothetical protein